MFSSENFQGNKPCLLSSRLHICQNFHFKFKSLDLLFKCTCAYIIQQWDSFSDFSCFCRMKWGLNMEQLKSLLISPPSNSVHPPIPPTWHQSNLFCTHYYKPQIGHQPLPCSSPHPQLRAPTRAFHSPLSFIPQFVLGTPTELCQYATRYYSPFGFSSIKTANHS